MVQQQQRTKLKGRHQQGFNIARSHCWPRVTKIIAGIFLALLLLFNFVGLFLENASIVENNALSIPIVSSSDRSPIVFICCERLRGEEGNRGQLARSLPLHHNELDVDVRYLNAPCFSSAEQEQGNPKGRGQHWPIDKEFPLERVQLFQQRIQEVYQLGGMVLAEGNCKIPQAELSNVWLESMLRVSSSSTSSSGQVGGKNETVVAVTPYILERFLLQDKKDLIRIIAGHGYQDFVPKHYNKFVVDTVVEYPVVLKREKSEGGVGVYIVHSEQEMEKCIQEDERYEGMGMRHKKSRHRTIGTGWVLEEFLPGTDVCLYVFGFCRSNLKLPMRRVLETFAER
jgi:hypothetical protein